jgi:prepilin-type N-terminal cleavage/methylation domain-containing protein
MVVKPKNNQGFTVLELLIAISVFSVTILMVTTVIIGISKQYQKGIISAQLSESARTFQQDIALAVGYQGGVTTGIAGGYTYLCSGQNQYFWKNQKNIGTGVRSIASPQGLYKKVLVSGVNCGVDSIPTNLTTDTNVANLLPGAGFVYDISVADAGTETDCTTGCTLNIFLKAGAKDMFIDGNISNYCLPVLLGGEYCTTINQTSYIKSKVGN